MVESNIEIIIVPVVTRVLVAAFIVILVAKLVVKLGPSMGGLIAGLPVGLGPGFYFLMQEGNKIFLFDAALFSLMALSATQFFLLAYLVSAKFFKPLNCSLISIGIWGFCASCISQIDFSLVQASFIFTFSTLITRYVGSFFSGDVRIEKKSENDFVLFFRAVSGGIIVSVVTVFASKLGAQLSGILLAFPIAYVLISFNIHKGFGKTVATEVVYSAVLGTVSLAVFCIAFAVFVKIFPLNYVLLVSLLGSVLTTSLMLIIESQIQKHRLFLK